MIGIERTEFCVLTKLIGKNLRMRYKKEFSNESIEMLAKIENHR